MVPQIAVIGSAHARKDFEANIEAAKALGVALAKSPVRLLFGVEGTTDHLPDIVYRSLASAGGDALGIYRTRGDYLRSPYPNLPAVITTMERAAGWEAVIVQSSDAVIAIGGGAGTLQEIAIANQVGIPVVVLRGSGGWADAFIDMPVDFRKRKLVHIAETTEDAVRIAIKITFKNTATPPPASASDNSALSTHG